MLWVVRVLVLGRRSGSAPPPLAPQYAPVESRFITPHGWLLDRLLSQARGLDGGLDKWCVVPQLAS